MNGIEEKYSKMIKESERKMIGINDRLLEEIENKTEKKYSSIIFDSEYEKDENWTIDTSIFDKLIKNKKNLLFLIFNYNYHEIHKTHGFYIEASINNIYDSNDIDFFEMEGIKDEKSFIFEIKNDEEIDYYELKKEKGKEVFYLYPPESEHLFRVGYDIEIFKRQHHEDNYQPKLKEYSLFQNSNNEMIEENKDDLLRIQIIQMEDENHGLVFKSSQDEFLNMFK